MAKYRALDKPIEQIRAGDFWQYNIGLRLTCRCGRHRALAGGELVKFFGTEWFMGPGRLELIRPRLKCGNCGAAWPQVVLAVLD